REPTSTNRPPPWTDWPNSNDCSRPAAGMPIASRNWGPVGRADNVAFGQRVDAVDRTVNGLKLVWVRTTLVVYGRQPEPEYMSLAEVKKAAVREPKPVELRRVPDLE